MVLLLGAMNEEISAFLNSSINPKEIIWNGFKCYESILNGREVCVAKTGVGKAMSALYTQHLIETYKPDCLIFTGLAGAINPDYKIGDIMLVKECVQYDLDAREFGFKLGEIPFTPYRFFQSDNKLLNLALKSTRTTGPVQTGRVLTGDSFISSKNRAKFESAFKELNGDAVEMEGAGVALAASVNKTPFLIIRIISDKADGSAPSDFSSFLHSAGEKALNIVSALLERL